MDAIPKARQVPRFTRGSVSALSQRSNCRRAMLSPVNPERTCRRAPTAGADEPALARQTISSPCGRARAVPVAPVMYCARSTNNWSAESSSVSPNARLPLELSPPAPTEAGRSVPARSVPTHVSSVLPAGNRSSGWADPFMAKGFNRVSPRGLRLSRAGGDCRFARGEPGSPARLDGRDTRPSTVISYLLRLSVFVPQPFDEHLFFWFVVIHEQVANAASADKVANFFRQVLGVVAGAFERLRHEDNLQAGMVRDVLRILDVTQEDDIAQAVHLGIGAKDIDGFLDILLGKRLADISQHLLQHRGHLGQVAGILRVEAVARSLRAGGKAQEQVPNALESDHDFHACEQLPGFGLWNAGDSRGHTGVHFPVNGIKFFFALPDVVQAGHRSGGNTLGRDSRSLAGQFAGFHRSLH